jgi:protein-L-isoaspartate(D-aspartate) O-methyltransferase
MGFVEHRKQMVKQQLVLRGIKDQRVLQAMLKVPRHLFVPENAQESAYRDGPLSIGEGQTISQPYMVGIMSECLGLQGGERVLEVGTGSGYQTAILAELAGHVYTIECIPSLLEKAREVLGQLKYTTISFKGGDGTLGWPEEGPFDGIIVTAGAPDILSVLVAQLNEGGTLVLPVGSRYSQTLYKITKRRDSIEKEPITLCVFVPLIGEYGWKDH